MGLKKSPNFVPMGRIDKRSSLVQAMAPKRRQAITWTNDDPIQWPIYTSPGLNEFVHISYTDDILISFGVFIYIVVSGEIECSVVSLAVYAPTLHKHAVVNCL